MAPVSAMASDGITNMPRACWALWISSHDLFEVIMVVLLLLSECTTDAAKLTLVVYDNELKCLLTTTPNHHICGYIALCIPLRQN